MHEQQQAAAVVVVVEVEIDLCRGMDLNAAVVDWVGGGKKTAGMSWVAH